MMLDHVEHLLCTRQALRPMPIEEAPRLAATDALRRNLLWSLGLSPFPRRTPLCARSVGRVHRQGYTVEKIIFQPRPGFTVPGHLYLPTDAPRPLPGILYASGHFVEHGIMYPDSQLCCIALAKLGFAVFAYEAMGQGERGPHWEAFRQTHLPTLLDSKRIQAFLADIEHESTGRRWLAWAWHALQGEHGQLAPRLVGLSQEGLMVWESIRALDYMCTREEIDATRLGMIGASGGGQNTYFTAGLDERVRAAASVCCLPSLTGQVRLSRGTNWWGGGDWCDQIPSHLTYGEFADDGALILPRPLLFVVGRHDDGFPIEEARSEYHRLASLYTPLAPGRLALAEVDGPHGISKPMREAAYGWFARWLQGDGDGSPISEPPSDPEPPDSSEMRCLPDRGAVSSVPALIELTDRLALAHATRRKREQRRLNRAHLSRNLVDGIRSVLGPEPKGDSQVEEIAQIVRSDIEARLLAHRTDPDITAFTTIVRPAHHRGSRPLTLIVHEGDWGALWNERWVSMLLSCGSDVAIADVRGTGPGALRTARPEDTLQALKEILLHEDHHGRSFVTDFEITSAYLILGRTLLGERVWDLLRMVDFLSSGAYRPTAITCLGIGHGGLVALFAAALDQRIEAAATWRAPASFRSLVVKDPVFPPSAFPFGVLRHFDLPEITATLAPRLVVIANARDGQGNTVASDSIEAAYKHTRQVYHALTRPERCHILTGPPTATRETICRLLATPDE